jgi:hypothetical protein
MSSASKSFGQLSLHTDFIEHFSHPALIERFDINLTLFDC